MFSWIRPESCNFLRTQILRNTSESVTWPEHSLLFGCYLQVSMRPKLALNTSCSKWSQTQPGSTHCFQSHSGSWGICISLCKREVAQRQMWFSLTPCIVLVLPLLQFHQCTHRLLLYKHFNSYSPGSLKTKAFIVYHWGYNSIACTALAWYFHHIECMFNGTILKSAALRSFD